MEENEGRDIVELLPLIPQEEHQQQPNEPRCCSLSDADSPESPQPPQPMLETFTTDDPEFQNLRRQLADIQHRLGRVGSRIQINLRYYNTIISTVNK